MKRHKNNHVGKKYKQRQIHKEIEMASYIER